MGATRHPVEVLPGFDCRRDNASCPACKGEKKADHGVSGGSAWFAVSNERGAVTLQVLLKKFPATVPHYPYADEPPQGAGLGFHKPDPDGEECAYVLGGKCSSDVTYLGGGDLYRDHGNQDPASDPQDQTEAFWLALEARLP